MPGGRTLPLVHFPCVMTASNGMTLGDGMTLFFVMKPAFLGQGVHHPGQRFFGTYPNGQMRLLDGHPSLHLR
ncbi:unnamed protein product [Choristocarpus tenellus]